MDLNSDSSLFKLDLDSDLDSDPKNLNQDLDSRKKTVDLNPDSNFRVPVEFKLLDADHNPTKLIFHCSVISVLMDARLCVKLICILKKRACIRRVI